MFKSAKTRFPRLLITGHSNSVIFCDDISIDQFLLFFFTQLVITRISSRVALHCKKIALFIITPPIGEKAD